MPSNSSSPRPEVSATTVATTSSTVPTETGAAPSPTEPAPPRELSAIAKQALAEAEARRRAREDQSTPQSDAQPRELGGRKGPDPVRYGDWENGGIASDF